MAPALVPPASGLVLMEAFSSLREAALRVTWPLPFLGLLLPDLWQTRVRISQLKLPLLVIHGTGDALFPVAMAQDIYSAARAAAVPAELLVLEGHVHNAPYLTVPEDYWAAIVDFIVRASDLPIPRGDRTV